MKKLLQEDKDLLVKELYARAPYHSMVNFNDNDGCDYKLGLGILTNFPETSLKLYLRPMSTLTAEEKEEMHQLLSPQGTAQYESDGVHTPMNHYGEFYPYEFMWRIIDWLNAHHFDYNGLIEKGLAIEAPKGMYNDDSKPGNFETIKFEDIIHNNKVVQGAKRVVLTPEQQKAFEDSMYDENGWMDMGGGLKKDRQGRIAGGLKLK